MRDISEADARRMMAIPKWGEPMTEWRQDRSHPHTIFNAFGVVDGDGATIPGLQVELLVYRAPRVVMERYLYTLFQLELGARRRVYQLHVCHKRGVRPDDHEYTHEHVGAVRNVAAAEWAFEDSRAAERRFCVNCSLTLTEPIPDFDAFQLR
jgi:hypothetical protein